MSTGSQEPIEELIKDIIANEKDWKLIADELGVPPIREEMLKKIRKLKENK